MHNLQKINWPSTNQLGLTCNLKLTILKIKVALHHQNRGLIIKQKHSAFIMVWLSVLHSMRLIGPTHSSQLREWHKSCITTLKHAICAPNVFLKLAGKPNNYQFYLPNFLNFCANISHKLLRPSQCLGKILEILEFAEIN